MSSINTKWNGKRWIGVATMDDGSSWEFIAETETDVVVKCQRFLGLTEQLDSSPSIRALKAATKRAAKKSKGGKK